MCKAGIRWMVSGYVIRFGSFYNRDLEGEYFSPKTLLDIRPEGDDLPIRIKILRGEGYVEIGECACIVKDEVGFYMDGYLFKGQDKIAKLIQQKVLHLVSMGRPIRSEVSGEITEYFLTGIALSSTPANPCPDNERADHAL